MLVTHFTKAIVDIMNKYFSTNNERVVSILLADYGFRIQFTTFGIQCNERVFASIGGYKYEWNEAPATGDWGLLGKQLGKIASLLSSSLLRIEFETGDTLDIETSEGPYESVVFDFPPRDNAIVMEVF